MKFLLSLNLCPASALTSSNLFPASTLTFSFLARRRCLSIHIPTIAATAITVVTTTPITIALMSVADSLVDGKADSLVDGKVDSLVDGKADPPSSKALVGVATMTDAVDKPDEKLTAVLLALRVDELVKEILVRSEISVPFGYKRTPVPSLQHSGALSQQYFPSGHCWTVGNFLSLSLPGKVVSISHHETSIKPHTLIVMA